MLHSIRITSQQSSLEEEWAKKSQDITICFSVDGRRLVCFFTRARGHTIRLEFYENRKIADQLVYIYYSRCRGGKF